MKLAYDRVEVAADGRGTIVGELHGDPGVAASWVVANRGGAAAQVRSVSLVWRVLDVEPPLRIFRNGYQSWSATSVATFGVDLDPSNAPGQVDLVRWMHHADPDVAEMGELRSELVTVLADAGAGPPLVVGFLGASEHDGTLRLRTRGDATELWAEAYLGGVEMQPGEARVLHPVQVWDEVEDPTVGLAQWASALGAAMDARTGAPYLAGWCSWYQYFTDVTEEHIRENLAAAGRRSWPFDVFQVDDGFQADIGDWLTTNEKFPSTLDELAADIAAQGRRPGIWIAPFLAGPGSAVATANPDWTVPADGSGSLLVGMFNPPWGGAVHVLDTTNPAVLAHLEGVARSLVEAGFSYLKLDFTYAPHFPGRYADPTRTPAQRVRAGFEAVRRGAGDATFLLGCGAPLGQVVGLVDGMRVGADVAPLWSLPPGAWAPGGYADVLPATENAFRNTLTRSFMHRRLWVNDPDCLMLRTGHTDLSPGHARSWAHAVAVSGGMVLVSDDLALVDGGARATFDEVVRIGRRADELARDDHPAHCDDLLDAQWPRQLTSGRVSLDGDALTGTATIREDPG